MVSFAQFFFGGGRGRGGSVIWASSSALVPVRSNMEILFSSFFFLTNCHGPKGRNLRCKNWSFVEWALE